MISEITLCIEYFMPGGDYLSKTTRQVIMKIIVINIEKNIKTISINCMEASTKKYLDKQEFKYVQTINTEKIEQRVK